MAFGDTGLEEYELLPSSRPEGITRRAVWVGIFLVVGVFVSACSSDDTVAPEAKLVSDVGEHYDDLEYPDGTVGLYRYQQVIFEGDMLLAEYDSAVQASSELFEPTECVIRVSNYRVFPPSATDSWSPPDFSLKTCLEVNYTDCPGGRLFYATVDGETVDLAFSGLVWIP